MRRKKSAQLPSTLMHSGPTTTISVTPCDRSMGLIYIVTELGVGLECSVKQLAQILSKSEDDAGYLFFLRQTIEFVGLNASVTTSDTITIDDLVNINVAMVLHVPPEDRNSNPSAVDVLLMGEGWWSRKPLVGPATIAQRDRYAQLVRAETIQRFAGWVPVGLTM